MKYLIYIIAFLIVIMVLDISSQVVYADAGYPTDIELRALPPYCTARLRMEQVEKSEVDKWRRILGPKNWTSLHHYCQELNIVNRANRTVDRETRDDLLRKALVSMRRFVNEQVQPDFILRHEVYYHMGGLEERLGNTQSAIAALTTSIKLNKKYASSYMALSDIYKAHGERDQALRIVEMGLAHLPKSKGLSRRKVELETEIAE